MKVAIYNSQTKEEFQEFDLASAIRTGGECTVGRSPTSGLILESSHISHTHGVFTYQECSYYFADTSSSNGSSLNNNVTLKNQAYLLKAGDVLQIGEFVLTPQPVEDYEDAKSSQVNQQIKRVSPMTFSQKFYQSHGLEIAEEFEQAIEANSLERIKDLLDKILELG